MEIGEMCHNQYLLTLFLCVERSLDPRIVPDVKNFIPHHMSLEEEEVVTLHGSSLAEEESALEARLNSRILKSLEKPPKLDNYDGIGDPDGHIKQDGLEETLTFLPLNPLLESSNLL